MAISETKTTPKVESLKYSINLLNVVKCIFNDFNLSKFNTVYRKKIVLLYIMSQILHNKRVLDLERFKS